VRRLQRCLTSSAGFPSSFGTWAPSSSDCLSFFANIGRRRLALAAENLFLRKQLALFREREKKALLTTPADRFVLSKLARWFDWRSALVIVKPATLMGWHRAAFRRF
jgi:putative transposase